MKALIAVLTLTMAGAMAFAEGEGGQGNIDQEVARMPHTVAGGHCAATIVNNGGENGSYDIVYGPGCATVPADPRAWVQSDYYTLFGCVEEAVKHCNRKDNVVASYDFHFRVRGYVCQEVNDFPSYGGN